MTATDLDAAWWDHLRRARWFGDKGVPGRLVSRRTIARHTPAGRWPAVTSEVAACAFDDGRTEHYHLLVGYRPLSEAVPDALGVTEVDGTAVAVVDATLDPACLAAFVAGVAPERAGAGVRVWGGEQSNTTLVLEPDCLLKLFRRLAPGPSREAEILAALTPLGCPTPALLGRVRADWPDGVRTDLGLSMARVTGAEDGWERAVAACRAGREFTTEARAVGLALRAVHEGLLAAFGGETRSGDDVAHDLADRLAGVARSVPDLAALLPRPDAVVAPLRGRRIPVQRVHGDFHLGQTLIGAAGATVIDFEGEPARPVAERDLPDSPWRDVAGLIRSLDYARCTHPYPGSAVARRWAERATQAFVEGYCKGTTDAADFLTAYVVDKAGYEVLYEVRNRPDWVHIPLAAIAETMERAHGSSDDN